MLAQAFPWIGAYYFVVNAVTLVVWGWDKRAAVEHRWRTPERTLHRLIFCGGFAGGMAGILLFRHKTRHPIFFLTIFVALALHLLAWYAAFRLMP